MIVVVNLDMGEVRQQRDLTPDVEQGCEDGSLEALKLNPDTQMYTRWDGEKWVGVRIQK